MPDLESRDGGNPNPNGSNGSWCIWASNRPHAPTRSAAQTPDDAVPVENLAPAEDGESNFVLVWGAHGVDDTNFWPTCSNLALSVRKEPDIQALTKQIHGSTHPATWNLSSRTHWGSQSERIQVQLSVKPAGLSHSERGQDP